MSRLFGMSETISVPVSGKYAGPSAQRMPVPTCSMVLL
jgi:hypothetical protein